MKKYVVAFISFYENELIQEIVESDTLENARLLHSKILEDGEMLKDLKFSTSDLTEEQFSEYCFNGSMQLSAIEI